ncbi:MAG: T9SS type A sorting domain-containing protein [candidate division Zixibacteria bacterium]|nr:T9SS type A sorting domain-containing protein [candidate division Zixibacteria bacterium]
MKSNLLVIAVFILLGFQLCPANPQPEQRIGFINSNPPQIGLFSHFELDISGISIATAQGTATVNDGVILPESIDNDPFILDSSNTSGFTFDPEGDFVSIDDLYVYDGFGQYGFSPAPLENHPLTLWPYIDHDMVSEILCYEFALPLWGSTDIVINEINAHSNWRGNTDFIELYNQSNEALSLADWRIVCDNIYMFPENAVIQEYGFYVLDEADFPELFAMDFDRDNIHLIDNISSNNYLGRVVDQVGWSSDHGADISFMRYPDGDVEYTGYPYFWDQYCGYDDESSSTFEDGFPTRGAPNRHESPGFVVIGAKADSIDDAIARIHWTDPIWDDTFTASMLVKSHDGYVATPEEGEVVYTGNDQEFTDQNILPELPYYFTVFARDHGGLYSTPTEESQAFIQFGGVGIEDENLPEHISVLKCYPNPFNATTTISFSLEHQSPVNISIYDITGRLVDLLASDIYEAGNHSLSWDAGNQPSGIYFARLAAGGAVSTSRMVLLK